MGQRCRNTVVLATIGKTIRRHIENAHDQGTPSEDQRWSIGESDCVAAVHGKTHLALP